MVTQMENMSEICLDAYTQKDFELFESLTQKGILTLFIYNKNLYYNGKREQMDPDKYTVRTELRCGTAVAPASVLSAFGVVSSADGRKDCSITAGETVLTCRVGEKTYDVNGKTGAFSIEPFSHLGHI